MSEAFHNLRLVSGGPSCNHSLWECSVCKRQWQDIHEWEGGHKETSSINADKEPCMTSPTDPIVCPRCGGPKVHDDIVCPGCAAVTGIAFDDLLARPGDCIDDPPARDYPTAFPEGAD